MSASKPFSSLRSSLRLSSLLSSLRGLGTAALLLTLGSCAAFDSLTTRRPSAHVRGVSLRDFALDAATLSFDVEIENPYGVPLPLVDLAYGLATRGAEFAAGRITPEGSVTAHGRRALEVPVRVGYAELLELGASLRPGTTIPWSAELELGVDAPGLGRLTLPLSYAGRLPIPAVLRVSLAAARWRDLSLTNVSGVLDLSLENPNDFALGLTRFDFALELGGERVAQTRVGRGAALAAGGSARLEVPLSFSPLTLGAGVLQILQGREATYRLRGDLVADTPFGPLSMPIDAAGRTALR